MRGRVPIAIAVGLLAVLLAAVAGRSTRAHHSRVISSSELLGARANASARLGQSESGEAEISAAATQDYENRAYPADAIDYSQTLGAISAGKAVQARGATSPKKWTQVGDGTMNVDTLGTQSFLRPTQWAGRTTAIALDYNNCTVDNCTLYIGAAGGGVWKTSNALADTPQWHEMNNGLDSLSIGALIIDPTDATGRTLYVGTGEPNGSSENEAGLGLYKSTDGGNHWALVPGSVAAAKNRGIGVVSVDPRNPNHILIGTDVARHGASATFGGRFTPPGSPPVGLYESTNGGQTFSLTLSRPGDVVNPNSANGSDFFKGGITDLEWDPNAAGVFYTTMTDYGVFEGNTATPGTFQQIFTARPDPAGQGTRYQLAVTDLGATTRIYLGEGFAEVRSAGALVDASGLYRTDNAAATHANADWTYLSSATDGTPGFSSFDFCRGQCSYDMPVATPPGHPDEVWLGGVTQYSELPTRTLRYRSNGRSVLRSTNAGVQFMDQSGDARHDWQSFHPDIHEIAFAPGGITFVGSDGGLTRTNGNYVDFSSDCDNRNNLQSRPVSYQDCKTWLSSVPERLITMNAGLPTLQLQDIAVDPTDPYNDLITGTQDNGSPFFDGKNGWGMNVQGDGAPPAIDKDGVIHYHQYSGEGIDVNFNGVTSGQWIWIGDPLLFSPEGAAIFYGSLIADPVASQTAFAGLRHVWRTQDSGNADKAFLAAHCNTNTGDLAGTGPNSGCGDWVPLGGAAGDLTAGPDSDKGNGVSGFISAQARAMDTHTMWVGTRRGRLFISQNIDAADPNAVTFTRLDTTAQPRRFVSGISVDANDPLHAIVSFSGFSAYTPAQPGHVFDVRYNATTHAATWTDISGNLGDQPVLDVAYDSATGDVYAATDFGVDRLVAGSTSWGAAANDLPKTAVYGLTLVAGKNPGDRLLYAATHGRGAWRTDLPSVK